MVGINPVLACGEANNQTLVSATSSNRYKLLYEVEKNLASEWKNSFSWLQPDEMPLTVPEAVYHFSSVVTMNLNNFATTFSVRYRVHSSRDCLSSRLSGHTVRELWVAELQIFARPGWVVLCAHGVFHALDVLLEVVERAKDVPHAIAVVHEGCV